MKKLIKKKGRQLLAVFLCLLTVLGILPIEVFAFTAQEGQSATSYSGSAFVGADGGYYYSSARKFIVYDSAGRVSVCTSNGGAIQHRYMIQKNGENRTVYCIESGIAYDSGNTYVSVNGTNSAYFQNLPYSAQYGIMLATVYGWQPGKSVPVSGCNEDDYIYATQCVIWEYQQQIRTSPYDMNNNAYGVAGNAFYATLVNRPAQKCYDWILEQMAQHTKLPSFAAKESSEAKTHTLKYDDTTGNYALTLTDTNHTFSNLKFYTENGISVTRSGNQYTFISNHMIEDAVILTAQKDVPGVNDDMLIWGRVGYQTMMCGTKDPVTFYIKINTETFGTGHIKKSSEDGKVEGVQFHITGNGVDETVTTGADGTVDIVLMPGSYTVTESVADWYEEQKSQSITIVSGKTSTVIFDNKLKRGGLEVIKTSEDSMVEGITFHLSGTSQSGEKVDLYAVTDHTGKAAFQNVLISGSTPYTLEEMDTDVRYVVPEKQNVPIEWNKVTKHSFENILKKFRIEVVKTDKEIGYVQGDANLAGAVYGLYQGDTLRATYTTDEEGAFTSDYFICDSNWTLKEISPSEGYLLDSTVYEIPAEAGNFKVELNTISEDVTEQVIKGRIRIVKHVDEELNIEDGAETTEPGKEVHAAAAESVSDNDIQTESVKSTEQQENTIASDSNADVSDSSDKIEQKVTEESSSATETTDTDEAYDQTEPEESPAETEIPDEYQPEEIPKEDLEASGGEGIIEQPEEGAKFQIYLTSAGSYDKARETERDILVTDSDGFAVSKDLPYGRYTVHQMEGKEGQAFVKDFTVFIRKDDQTYSYIMNNQTQSSLIRVEKHDIESGKIIPAANIGFQVRDMATGELITQTVYYPTPVKITTFFTNDEGWLMLPCELPYGEYELIEVETCYGYVLDSTPVPFTVDGSQDVVVVEKHNIAQKGTISVSKTGEVWSTVSTTDKEGDCPIYTPIYEVKGLADAVYEIRVAEDIYTLDGTLRAAKGDVVDTITTGEDGSATSKELYLGQYEVVEIEAPHGMVLNSEAKQVTLTYAGQDVTLTEASTGFYNDRQKVKVSLEKIMEQNKDFGIGSNGEILNVTFGLYAAEDLTAADGSVIPAEGLIEIIAAQKDGTAVVEKDLPMGSYYLQEMATDAHYLLSAEKYPVTFAYAGQETALVEIKANDGDSIENKLLYGSVSGKKVDENGEALEGAKIGIFAPDVEEFTEKTAILVATSGEDGTFQFDKVPYGKWIVREIESPEGFVLCTDLFEVNIKSNEQIIQIEITNEFIRGNLHLTKFDKDYPENKLSGAVFEVYRDTNGNKKLDKEDELLGMMKEVEAGEYVMNDLLYGGVFVKEKTAPDGFCLDEGIYYVSIETDGETYEVENNAGKGFYNQAQRGNLKIIKTSSDGKTDGFSFRIVGENYDQTFKTDANGVILIEGLRIGKYTVTEVEDSISASYKRPDPVTVELVADETLTVRVYNNKITVDVPKTGDESQMGLWLALLGISMTGLGAVIYFIHKKSYGKRRIFKKKKHS